VNEYVVPQVRVENVDEVDVIQPGEDDEVEFRGKYSVPSGFELASHEKVI